MKLFMSEKSFRMAQEKIHYNVLNFTATIHKIVFRRIKLDLVSINFSMELRIRSDVKVAQEIHDMAVNSYYALCLKRTTYILLYASS